MFFALLLFIFFKKLIVWLKMFCNIKRVKKAIRVAITGRITQPKAILLAMLHFTSFPPFRIPMPMTAPTIAWELDTGTRGIEGRFIELKKIA